MPTQRFNGGAYRNVDEVGLSGINARLIDCYIDDINQIVGRFGYEDYVSTGITGRNRGIYYWSSQNAFISCIGTQVFKIDASTSVVTNVTGDPLNDATYPVTFTTDGSKLWIASGGKMVTLTPSGTSTYISHANAPTNVTHVVYLDGYIIANAVGTGRFHFTDVNDTDVWPVDGFATAENNPDSLLALEVYAGELYLHGNNSTEVWANDGVSPFSPIRSAYLEHGIGGKYSYVKSGSFYFWIDNERRVIQLAGRQAVTISVPYQDVINGLTNISDCVGFSILSKGTFFIIFTFPTDNFTLCYNSFNQTWTEFGSWNGSTYDIFDIVSSVNTNVGVSYETLSVNKNSGTGADDATVGTVIWTNPTNAQGASDSTFANAEFSADEAISHYLKLTNFNFTLQSSATIVGVKVLVSTVNPKNSTLGMVYGEAIEGDMLKSADIIKGTVRDYNIKLVKSGTITGNNKASVADVNIGALYSYGDINDMWGVTLSPADVNSSTFGVVLSYQCSTYTYTGAAGEVKPFADIDSVKVYIYYVPDTLQSSSYGNIVGHISDGNLYVLSDDVYTDDGGMIRPFIRTGQFTYGTLKDKVANRVRLSLAPVSGTLNLRWKNDNSTYSNTETMSLSETPVMISGLGRYKTRQYEIWYEGNTKFVFADFEEDTDLMEF